MQSVTNRIIYMAMVISYRVEVTGMRVAPAIDLSPEARTELQRLVRRRTTPVRVTQRCCIVLLAAEGLQNKQIAARMAVARRFGATGSSRSGWKVCFGMRPAPGASRQSRPRQLPR
jgi:hypothetical protein